LHRSLKSAVLSTGATEIYLVGRAIEGLADDLGEGLVAGRARRIEDLMAPILSSLAFGDAVMVKGSKGVRLASLVEQIKQRFSAAP
jgi:UDP-N-acetylmuramoyl-tripeptide--D-alanyl-D-alanine ligase